MSQRARKRSLTLHGHRTSVSLEPVFWEAFQRLAAARSVSVNALAAMIDDRRTREDPEAALASAIRVAVLQALEAREI